MFTTKRRTVRVTTIYQGHKYNGNVKIFIKQAMSTHDKLLTKDKYIYIYIAALHFALLKLILLLSCSWLISP